MASGDHSGQCRRIFPSLQKNSLDSSVLSRRNGIITRNHKCFMDVWRPANTPHLLVNHPCERAPSYAPSQPSLHCKVESHPHKKTTKFINTSKLQAPFWICLKDWPGLGITDSSWSLSTLKAQPMSYSVILASHSQVWINGGLLCSVLMIHHHRPVKQSKYQKQWTLLVGTVQWMGLRSTHRKGK